MRDVTRADGREPYDLEMSAEDRKGAYSTCVGRALPSNRSHSYVPGGPGVGAGPGAGPRAERDGGGCQRADHGRVPLAPSPWVDQEPAIALGASQYYFVVWKSTRSYDVTDYDIYGQRMFTDGTLSGHPVPVTTASDAQVAPDLAYGHASATHLVVWQDHRGTVPDIYGQRVDSCGNLVGGEILISDAANGEYHPRVAYNIDDGECLVV